MIGRLTGVIKEKHPPFLLLDVNGVGYEMLSSMTTFYALPELEQQTSLHTHLLVREDALTLYAFYTREERLFFQQLIKVSGIGAKLALAILSGISRDNFVLAVQQDDVTTLVKLPGIGKKTAERIIIEMRDKIANWSLTNDAVSGSSITSVIPANSANEAIGALVSLGYKSAEAAKMINALDQKGKNSEDLIKTALKNSLSGQ